jgi:hypothetical protein
MPLPPVGLPPPGVPNDPFCGLDEPTEPVEPTEADLLGLCPEICLVGRCF